MSDGYEVIAGVHLHQRADGYEVCTNPNRYCQNPADPRIPLFTRVDEDGERMSIPLTPATENARLRSALAEVVEAAESNTPTPGFALDVVAASARRALAEAPRVGRSPK